MKRVACYCRVSTDEQVKFGFSIQAQKDTLEKYCKDNNYQYEFYIDEGISASSMNKRKALLEMLDKSNVFDMILFTKLDRLSRNVLDANNINKILQENNCTMKAIDEDDVDTSTADGMFIFNLKVSLAQREIGKTSERIKFVFDNKRKKGEVTSGTKKYGYDIIDKKYVVNEEEAQNIKNLFNYFINVNGSIPLTYSYFIEHFKNKGYDAMKNYLRETAYIGKYKLYRKNTFIDNYIPPILDINTWNKAQNLLVKKQRFQINTSKQTALFSGILYCFKCKARLHKKQDNRVKSKLMRYGCTKAYRFKVGNNNKKCTNTTYVREDYIENYLLENILKELNNYKVKCLILEKKYTKIDNTKEIQKIQNKINKLKDLYLEDLIDKETYTLDYKKYNLELEKLKEPKKIEIKKDFSQIEKILNSNYKEIYEKLTLENKRKFWLTIIDKIYIENGKIKEVIFL